MRNGINKRIKNTFYLSNKVLNVQITSPTEIYSQVETIRMNKYTEIFTKLFFSNHPNRGGGFFLQIIHH